MRSDRFNLAVRASRLNDGPPAIQDKRALIRAKWEKTHACGESGPGDP